MKYISITVFLFCVVTISFSQETYWDSQLLEISKGKKVIRWDKPVNYNAPWVSILKVKKKVGIYTVTISEAVGITGKDSTFIDYVNNPISPKYDEIARFQSIPEDETKKVDDLQGKNVEVVEARIKEEIGIVVHYGDEYETAYLDAKHFFQSIDWEKNNGTHVPVMIKNKWGIYNWYQQNFLFECEFTSLDDLPKTSDRNGFTPYTAGIFKAFNKDNEREQIGAINLLNVNTDGVFLAQSKATDKYGLYQFIAENNIIEAIPMKYDSIHYFSWNRNFIVTFNEGKVGIYLSYWIYDEEAKESVPCMYEDYTIVKRDVDNITVLAVKKNNKWGWINWLTGEEKSEFTFETAKDLPYPYYEQKYWFEE